MQPDYFGHACTVFAWRAAHVAYWPSSSIAQACQAPQFDRWARRGQRAIEQRRVFA